MRLENPQQKQGVRAGLTCEFLGECNMHALTRPTLVNIPQSKVKQTLTVD